MPYRSARHSRSAILTSSILRRVERMIRGINYCFQVSWIHRNFSTSLQGRAIRLCLPDKVVGEIKLASNKTDVKIVLYYLPKPGSSSIWGLTYDSLPRGSHRVSVSSIGTRPKVQLAWMISTVFKGKNELIVERKRNETVLLLFSLGLSFLLAIITLILVDI